MKFCPECGANWQNQYSDICAVCGYKVPAQPAVPMQGGYAPPTQAAGRPMAPYSVPTPSAVPPVQPQQGYAPGTPVTPAPYGAPTVAANMQPPMVFDQDEPDTFEQVPNTVAPPLFEEPAAQAPAYQPPAVQPAAPASLFDEGGLDAEPPLLGQPNLSEEPPLFGGQPPAQDSLFDQPPAGGEKPLFDETVEIAPVGASRPPLFEEEPPPQKSVAAKAASLQALLEAEDDMPAYDRGGPQGYDDRALHETRPYNRARYEESYEDDYYEEEPQPRRRGDGGGRGGQPPRSSRERDNRRGRDDAYEEGYDDRGGRGGGRDGRDNRGSGNGGGRKGLVILAVVLAIAIVATLIFGVLYFTGFLGGGSRGNNNASSTPATSVSQVSSQAPVSSSPADFAAQLTTAEINEVLATFYGSYLQCINLQSTGNLQNATELCRAEVETRIAKPANRDNEFNFTSAACDEQSVVHGEDQGRPAITFNAKFEYTYRPKADTAAEFTNGSNYQTIQLVYEQYQWRVNRFVIVSDADYASHTLASFT